MALLGAAVFAAAPQTPKLGKAYEAWLKDEVNYLITKDERELFLAIKTDGEREAFIRAFWARRDPVPVTAVNEFRDEHYRRLAEAKAKFGIHTDRGRTFILLGPPNTIDNETSGRIVFPCEVWNYTNLSLPGIPNSLRLLFFKPWGVGDFRLYSPLFDGLEYLVPQRHYDFGYGYDAEIKNLIRNNMGLDFLQATQSITPGTDQLGSEKVLAALRDPAAFEALRPSGRPLVTTTVSLEKLPFEAAGFYSTDGRDNYYYDASLSVASENLTFERSGDKYYGRGDVYVTIRDSAGNIIAQFNDQLGLELGEDEMKAKRGYRLGYAFSHLLIAGEYTMNILLRDFVSSRIGERDLRISLPAEGRSTPLLLSGRREDAPAEAVAEAGKPAAFKAPFVFGRSKVTPRIDAAFAPDESVYLYFEILPRSGDSKSYLVDYIIRDARSDKARSDAETLALPAGARALPVEKVFSLKGLAQGTYTLSVNVSDLATGTALFGESAEFKVSPGAQAPGMFSFEQSYRPGPEVSYTDLGRQAFFRGDYARARRFFGIALGSSPGFVPAKILLAKCHVLEGNSGSALNLLQPLAESGSGYGEVYTILGNIAYGRKDLELASRYLEKAADLIVESVEILNFLGGVYLEMGNKAKAREILSRSLTIKADQPLVKSLLDSLNR